MLKKIEICPIEEKFGDLILFAAYQHAGKYRMLLDDDTFMDYNSNIQPTKENPNPHPRERSFTFNKLTYSIKYEYESDAKSQTEYDKQIENTVINFWGKHPQIVKNGKNTSYTKNAAFNLKDETLLAAEEHDMWQKKIKVATYINELNGEQGIKELADICFYYGVTPGNKNDVELKQELASLNTTTVKTNAGDKTTTKGVVTNESEINNFISVWMDKANKERIYTVNARKALHFEIIVNREEGGNNNYYHQETLVGTSFNDIISYFKREPQVYENHIIRTIADKEQNLISIPSANAITERGTAGQQSVIQEYDALRTEAAQLKEEGFVPKESKWYLYKEASIDKLREAVQSFRDAKTKPLQMA